MAITEYDLGNVKGDINDSVATFTEATNRANIASGETGKTIFGKIKKWFADMTISAFSTVVNNATTTVANTVLDGRMGKILMDKFDELNRNIEYTLPYAIENGILSNALLVDLINPFSDVNKPRPVGENSKACPANMAWGVREVIFVGQNAIIIRITGIKKNGVTNCIWLNTYNYKDWMGWSEH